ncbi:ROK family protein [Devosia elaeis]|uniref:ROK family protein n=1 Tax=Devosia elaeis TaxID=1770058 RepID=A0A178I4P1_9HYPH|nr:ROK family protein [Devosia elaeis]OAM79254.1 hypothetical protein A3840_04080 [Devosia elaeis]
MSDLLGVDIGGTKIQFSRIGADYAVSPLKRMPTALLRRGTPAFAADLAELIRATMPPGLQGAAVSLNGALRGSHVVYSSLMGGNVGFELADFLRDRLDCPVYVDDDIHAMTRAEAEMGLGRGYGSVTMLNMGTGIGVGAYESGVLRGKFGAGLISEQHVYVEELGEHRILDRVTCGRGIKDLHLALTGEIMEAVNVFAGARDNDPACQRTVDIFARYVGTVLEMISKFYNPELIVLNGSVKHAAPQYLETALRHYRSLVGERFRAEVLVSELDFAAEIGVALQQGDMIGGDSDVARHQ